MNGRKEVEEAENNNNLPEASRPTIKLKGLVKKGNSVFISIPQQQGCEKRRSAGLGKGKGLKRCLNGISSPHLLDLGCSSKGKSNRRKPGQSSRKQPLLQQKAKVAKRIKSEQVINVEDCDQTRNEENAYQKLMLSLGSPLPNEHELSLGTCLRLSSVGDKGSREVNLIGRNPAILRMLLAHAGFYEDCGLRALMEETFVQAYGLNFASFWEELCGSDHQLQGLLCECYHGELTELTEEEKCIWLGVESKGDSEGMIGAARLGSLKCCSGCQVAPALAKMEMDSVPELPITLTRSSGHFSEKLVKRVQLVGTILSNFSFQSEDAIVMAGSATMLRFLLLTAQIRHPTIARLPFLIISNISKYLGTSKDNVAKSVECQQLVISIAHLGMKTVFSSPGRLKIIRGLEALEGFARGDDNLLKLVVTRRALYARLFQLLTLNQDVLLVAACLNCLLAMSEIGKESCQDIVRVPGSISTLISYLTVEFLASKPAIDEELAVTNSVRLTAAITLRNLTKRSSTARRSLACHESRLAEMVMLGYDCSAMIAKILHCISLGNNQEEDF